MTSRSEASNLNIHAFHTYKYVVSSSLSFTDLHLCEAEGMKLSPYSKALLEKLIITFN
jgi:hypothetical protein